MTIKKRIMEFLSYKTSPDEPDPSHSVFRLNTETRRTEDRVGGECEPHTLKEHMLSSSLEPSHQTIPRNEEVVTFLLRHTSTIFEHWHASDNSPFAEPSDPTHHFLPKPATPPLSFFHHSLPQTPR